MPWRRDHRSCRLRSMRIGSRSSSSRWRNGRIGQWPHPRDRGCSTCRRGCRAPSGSPTAWLSRAWSTSWSSPSGVRMLSRCGLAARPRFRCVYPWPRDPPPLSCAAPRPSKVFQDMAGRQSRQGQNWRTSKCVYREMGRVAFRSISRCPRCRCPHGPSGKSHALARSASGSSPTKPAGDDGVSVQSWPSSYGRTEPCQRCASSAGGVKPGGIPPYLWLVVKKVHQGSCCQAVHRLA